MTPVTDAVDRLLADLDARDIRLSVVGGRLRCDAPRGGLTPELRETLAQLRDQLLSRLPAVPDAIPVRPRDGNGLPLSHAQRRLWLLDRLEGGTPRYNLVAATRVRGPLDVAAVNGALRALVHRHEILRTGFLLVGGDVVQIPLPECSIAVVEEECAHVPRAGRSAAIEAACREESSVVFDLAKPPLLRVRLLRFAPDDQALILNQHHIVTDARSVEILSREFEELIAGRALPPLTVQYADYAAWQRDRVTGDALDRGVAFWTRALDGLPELLPLPTDVARPATQTYRGGSVRIRVPAPLVEKLQGLARETGATLFMVMHTALCVVLARQSGSRDIAVGVPVTNRPRPELERLAGFFANALVLRCRIEAGVTWRTLLRQGRDTMVSALAHQETPFETLVEKLRVRRALSYTPIFQVMLSFMNRDVTRTGVESPLERLEIPQQHALFELDWQLRETADGIVGFLMYAADLFSPKTAERMVARFIRTLEVACEHPDAACDALDIIPSDERREMLEEWNATHAEYPTHRPVHDLIHDQVRRTPDAVAITHAGESWTYRRLDEAAHGIAVELQRVGVRPGALVGVCVERSPRMVAALLGILKAGAAYVPLDPGFPAERLAFMATDSRAMLTLSESGVAKTLRDRLAPIAPVLLLDDLEGRSAATAPAVPLSSEALANTIYTSGSTGLPKGVMVEHRALVNFLTSMARQPGLTGVDALLAVTTLSFDIAALELFLPLMVGARIVLASREDVADPHRLIRLLETEAVTVMQATPATWRLLLAAGWHGRAALTVLCGGEALPSDLSRLLLDRCAALWNMYGPTETTVWSAVRRILPRGNAATGLEPIGRPVANTQIYIVTPDSRLLPAGAIGELCIGGDGLARGYLNQPELTAERFVPDPFSTKPGARMYRTGDQARLRPDGDIEFLGRLDHQIKLRGFRIEPGEIESVLGRLPGILQCAVVIREDAPGDPRLIAYYVPADQGRDVSAPSIREHLRRSVPDYMVPSALVPLDRLPLTPNGKVDRRLLPAPDIRETRGAADHEERPVGLEVEIAALWEQVLGVGGPSLDANFFDLGGHSLLIVHLHQRLQSQLGVTFDVLDLFRYPTIRQQASALGGERGRRDIRAEAGGHAKRQQQALKRQRAWAAGRASHDRVS